MAGITLTTSPADVANRLQTHFSRKLLKALEFNLVLDQFAYKEDLPKNLGSKIIRFFRRRSAKTDDVQALTEGTAINVFTQVEMGYVDVTLAQRGEATRVSDVMRLIDLFKPLEQNIQAMGEDAAKDFDTITRNKIVGSGGLLNSDNGFERFAGLPRPTSSAGEQSVDRFASLAAQATANSKITRGRALNCATQLKLRRVPRLNGGYVALVSPAVVHDMRQDASWFTAAARSNDARRVYKREVLEVDGISYIENDNSFIEDDVYGTYDDVNVANPEKLIYSTVFLGQGAYGCPKLEGTTSPMAPQVITVTTPDSNNPLLQYFTAGWKAFWNAVLLKTNLSYTAEGQTTTDIPFAVNLRTKSSFELAD